MEITYFSNDLSREELDELNEDSGISREFSQNVYQLPSGKGIGLEKGMENQ